MKAFLVTHLYEFARGLRDLGLDQTTFLRAERLSDGTRTVEGEPLETSHGRDVFKAVFPVERGEDVSTAGTP